VEGHDGGGDDDVQPEVGTEAVAKEEAHAEAAGSAWDLAEVASWRDTRARFKHVSQEIFVWVLFEEEQARPLTSVITYHSLREASSEAGFTRFFSSKVEKLMKFKQLLL